MTCRPAPKNSPGASHEHPNYRHPGRQHRTGTMLGQAPQEDRAKGDVHRARCTSPRTPIPGSTARALQPWYQAPNRMQAKRNACTPNAQRPCEARTDDTRPRVPPVVLRGWAPTANLWNSYGELPSDEEPVDEESSTAPPEALPSFGGPALIPLRPGR